MNDDELITVLREQRGRVPMTTPVEQIIGRGRAVRARRRAPGVAASVGAAAAAVALGIALPSSHPAASHPAARASASGHPASEPDVHLAAWTVTRQADGSIQITFREAADAAALQRTLRADGVPASVTFTGQQNPACQSWDKPGPVASVFDWSRFAGHPENAYTTPYALVIQPSALPSGAGVQISTSGTPGAAGNFQLSVGLVKASPQCTGS
jgi:hypothetical protein